MWFRPHNLAIRTLAAAVVAAALCLPAPAAHAEPAQPSREYSVKAAFLYHFLQFTEWPPGAFARDDAPLVVAVLGDNPFDGALRQALAGKTVGRRPVLLKCFEAAPPDFTDLAACHLLFVSAAQRGQQAQLLRQLDGGSVLTVSDDDRFLEAGGVIRLLVDENKVRFEINLTAARRQQLKLSAKLLNLARLYEEPTQ